jgi:hypothetical protein
LRDQDGPARRTPGSCAARDSRSGGRHSRGSSPLQAASIFLDILNAFLFFLQIFSREE